MKPVLWQDLPLATSPQFLSLLEGLSQDPAQWLVARDALLETRPDDLETDLMLAVADVLSHPRGADQAKVRLHHQYEDDSGTLTSIAFASRFLKERFMQLPRGPMLVYASQNGGRESVFKILPTEQRRRALAAVAWGDGLRELARRFIVSEETSDEQCVEHYLRYNDNERLTARASSWLKVLYAATLPVRDSKLETHFGDIIGGYYAGNRA